MKNTWRKYFVIPLISLSLSHSLPSQAQAGDVILMVNMNYSSSEIKALDEIAAERGQRVEMVPPREMISLVEPMFLKRDALQAELAKNFPGENPLNLKSALAGIMRKGAAWEADPKIASYVGDTRMNELYGMAQKISQTEQKYGEIYEQLKRKSIELKAKGDKVDSLVLSSHSDGSKLTGETATSLSSNDLYKLKQEQPELFESPRHVLLLGCYNLTKPNHKAWRYDLFPYASMLGGFGIQAPSRFDEKSANFIRQSMRKAHELDKKMIGNGNPLDFAFLESEFKALSTFTTERHPGVVDYCYNVIEGRPGTWSRDCEQQWRDLYEKKEKMRQYWSLESPQEDPPSIGGGELRNFYNTLQSACPAQEARSEKDDWRASERMRVTFRENTIRLIFWWNVQHNFSTYYEREINSMEHRLQASGIYESIPKLDGTVSRVRFVQAYNTIVAELERRSPALKREFEQLYSPLYLLKGEETVAAGEKIGIEATLARRAIPFPWIEGTSVMKRRTQ